MVGLTPAAIGKIERGETTRPNNWEAIAAAFNIPHGEAEELINLDVGATGKLTKALSTTMPSTRVTPRWKTRRSGSGKVPILGYAAAGEPDRFIMLNDVSGEADVPAPLSDVEGAYALYVYGTSMIPRYYPGELVYVHPRKPLTPDCFCVVQVGRDKNNPDGGFIKQYKSWDSEKLHVFQFNPDREIDFPNDMIIDVHRIVGSGDD